jgi:peptide/nickel transport system permease protein
MLAYAIRRLLLAIPIFFGISLLVWGLVTTNPDGGPLASYLGKLQGRQYTQQQIDNFKHALGLDRSLPEQYLIWVKNLLQGNLGNSFETHLPVTETIAARIVPTLLLVGVSYILQLGISIPLGVFSAVRRGSFAEQLITVLTYIGFSLPTFWVGLVALIIFSVELGWTPVLGMVDLRTTGAPFATPAYWTYFHAHTIPAILDIAHHIVLPATVLALVSVAGDSRFMRAQMLEVLNQDYVRTARAKGLSERAVIYKHALRNALLPEITNIGLAIPFLLAGAIVTEQIFSWPGMGQLYIQASRNYDYPVIVGYVMLLATLLLIFNVITDLVYAVVDPRIRYS